MASSNRRQTSPMLALFLALSAGTLPEARAQASAGDLLCYAPPNGNHLVVHAPTGGVVTAVSGGGSAWWQGSAPLRDGGLATLALTPNGFELLLFDGSGQFNASFPLPQLTTAHDTALGPTSELWILDFRAFPPGPMQALRRYTLDGTSLGAVDVGAFGIAPDLVRVAPDGGYWLVRRGGPFSQPPTGSAARIDPGHGFVASFALPFAARAAGVGRDGALWVTSADSNEVAVFDVNGVRVGGFVPDMGLNSVGGSEEAHAVAPDLDGGVWLSAGSSPRVRRFDATGNVLATFDAATGGIPLESLKVIDYGAPLGAGTCSGVVNSTGSAGLLETTGELAVAANSLTLAASALPSGSTALFLASRSFALLPMPGGSQGNLCLGAPIGRFVGPGQVQPVGSSGRATLHVDTTALPTPSGLVALASGETWHFQCWYRDVVAGAAASNFTGARSVTFP